MTAEAGTGMGPALSGLVAWIESETGLHFPEVHHDTIRKAAERRSRELGLDPGTYEDLLRLDGAEKCLFLNEVMIGETYFFRDERHFSILISHILPALFLEGRELLLWSATCATGEEALSLVASALHVREVLEASADFSVLASDINLDALSSMKSGRFPQRSFRDDGRPFHGLLDRCGAMEGEAWQASGESLSKIRIRHLNILSGDFPEPESVDVVFFRNTLVYMRQEQKERAVARIVETIRPGGFLFLASPEIPTVRHPRLEVQEAEGSFYFRKLSRGARDSGVSAETERHARKGRAKGKIPAGGKPNAGRPVSGATGENQAASADEKPARRRQTPIGAAELAKGLRLASERARNPPSGREPPEDRPETELALMIEGLVAAIQSNRFDLASKLLSDFESLARENYISLYLRALLLRHRGDQAQALELLERARIYEPGFWPALFQAGMAYEKTNPERSRTLLRECLDMIGSLEDEGGFIVLLEGFDTPYYRRMAEKLLARMDID